MHKILIIYQIIQMYKNVRLAAFLLYLPHKSTQIGWKKSAFYPHFFSEKIKFSRLEKIRLIAWHPVHSEKVILRMANY